VRAERVSRDDRLPTGFSLISHDTGISCRCRAKSEGRSVRVQPGVIGQHVNDLLKPFNAKIGPDPASISVARLGGILSNHASGMCCGVSHNAYHTLRSMKFMVPSGTVIDTAWPDADARFEFAEPILCSRIMQLKDRIERSEALAARIRSKYRIKKHNRIIRKMGPVASHPVCSVIKTGIVEKLAKTIGSCSREIVLPATEDFCRRNRRCRLARQRPPRAENAIATLIVPAVDLRDCDDSCNRKDVHVLSDCSRVRDPPGRHGSPVAGIVIRPGEPRFHALLASAGSLYPIRCR
jgi:FAD binding domain